MRTITVEPEQLEVSASRIDEDNQAYQRTFAQLCDAVDTMKAGWEGKDNVAFSTKIRKFEADFREMSVLCAQYAEFLRNSARAYRETQDDLASQASHLSE